MGTVYLSLAMSLDGFITGPNPRPGEPMGDGGERLHEWMAGMADFRERGDTVSADAEVLRELSSGQDARQPGTSPGTGCSHGSRRRSRPPARSCRRIPRCLTPRRLRGAARGARPGRHPPSRPRRRARQARSAVPRPWPTHSRGVPGSHDRRSSTEPPEPCGLPADDRVSYLASPSVAVRSSRSTCSPTPRT